MSPLLRGCAPSLASTWARMLSPATGVGNVRRRTGRRSLRVPRRLPRCPGGDSRPPRASSPGCVPFRRSVSPSPMCPPPCGCWRWCSARSASILPGSGRLSRSVVSAPCLPRLPRRQVRSRSFRPRFPPLSRLYIGLIRAWTVLRRRARSRARPLCPFRLWRLCPQALITPFSTPIWDFARCST